MKIEWNKENNTITVGKAVFSEYTNFKSALHFAFTMLEMNAIESSQWRKKITYAPCSKFEIADEVITLPKMSFKERNKEIGNVFGCSISRLYKYFDGLQKKAFIVPVYPVYKALVDYKPWKVKKKEWDQGLLKNINSNKQLLLEVMNDGLKHILPVVHKAGKHPKELKKEYGRNWKTITHNSLNKNKALVYKSSNLKVEEKMKLIEYDIPTTLLQNKNIWSAEALKYLKDNFKGSWGKHDTIWQEYLVANDTKHLAEQLGKKMSWKWSPRRMKEEHDKMAAEINARKYSKDKFDSTQDISVKWLKSGDYVATLLESAFDIADEGTSMGHCVGLYAGQVKQGDYLVYTVTKAGERSSTIGLHRRAINKDKNEYSAWNLNQHYGRFNAALKDEDEIKLGQVIVDMLNKEI